MRKAATAAKPPQTESVKALEAALAAIRRAFVVVACFSFFLNLLMLAVPLYMLQLFDRVVSTGNESTLIVLTLMVVVALLVMASLEAVRAYIGVRLGNWIDRRLAGYVLGGSVNVALQVGGTPSAQGLRDLGTLRTFLSGNGLFPILDAPWVPVFLAVVFMMHPILGIIATTGAVVLFGFALLNELTTRKVLSEAGGASMRAFNSAESAVHNADVISAMGMLPDLIRRWREESEDGIQLQGRASERAAAISAAAKFVRLLLQVAMLGTGACLVTKLEITGGVMIAASVIMARAVAPVEQMIGTWRNTVQAQNAYKRVRTLIEQAPDLGARTSLPAPKGELLLDRVSFAPPGLREPVIKQVSFRLEPGEALGLIGPTAAGKSTLARLVVGSLRQHAGHVRFDGADMSVWDPVERGRHVGYLPQDVELFNGTVRDNIARLREASDEEVVAAAQMAGAHDMIVGLPKAYDTPIGEGGVPLSGGQRQRIALARAVFGNPRLLVLDEPNASLDSVGEQALIETVARMRAAGCTIVLIAHRPNVLGQMDKILILRNGAVEKFGPRDEVLAALSRPVAVPGGQVAAAPGGARGAGD